MESTGQRVSTLLHDLEEELAARDREIAELHCGLASRAPVLPAGILDLIDEQQEQLSRTRELLQSLEAAALAPPPPPSASEEIEQLQLQLESEREEHRQQIEELTRELEAAREAAVALEAILLEQRGALQRIEAKFNLYAAAVLKLLQPPVEKRPKLLPPSKKAAAQKPKADGFFIR